MNEKLKRRTHDKCTYPAVKGINFNLLNFTHKIQYQYPIFMESPGNVYKQKKTHKTAMLKTYCWILHRLYKSS